jgi:hypothetical protein
VTTRSPTRVSSLSKKLLSVLQRLKIIKITKQQNHEKQHNNTHPISHLCTKTEIEESQAEKDI